MAKLYFDGIVVMYDVVANVEQAAALCPASVEYAIYGVGCVLLASGLNYKFASECVAGLRARGQVVTMCEI